jgi:uncharacterized membrane protein YvbJ
MKCPSCGNDNSDNKFCTKCGEKLLEKKALNKQEVKHKTQFNRKLIIGSISLFSVLSIFFLIDLANNSQQNNKVLVQQESNNNNEIKKQESTISPVPNSSQLQPSPSPSKTNIVLDDKKIVGNLMYDPTVSTMYFSSFDEDFNDENLWDSDSPKTWFFTIFFDSNLTTESWNQIKESLTKYPEIEIETEEGWVKYPDQYFECDDEVIFSVFCTITLEKFDQIALKKYTKSTTISFRVLIPIENAFPVEKLELKNMDIVRLKFTPATCKGALDAMTSPSKGFFYTKKEYLNILTNSKNGIC